MKLELEDEKNLAELLAELLTKDQGDRCMDVCGAFLNRVVNANDDEASDFREMINQAVALMKENAECKAETGLTLHEEVLDLIAAGDHDGLVQSIIAIIEMRLFTLPPNCHEAETLRHQLEEYIERSI